MLGYKYKTEEEAITAQNSCNAFYDIPKNKTDVTQNWCGYNYDISGFWYIIYDESLLSILGQPIEFQITENEVAN